MRTAVRRVLFGRTIDRFTDSIPPAVSYSRTGPSTALTTGATISTFAANVPPITNRGLLIEPAATNLLLNSEWGGGAAPPTNWTNSGTPTGAASTLLPSVQALTFATSASRVWIVQIVTTTGGVAYAVSCFVESVTGTIQANQVINSGLASPITWPVCSANPSGGATGQVQAGRLVAIFTPAGGTDQVRFGAGVTANQTATVRLSLPQVELTSPSSPIPTTGSALARGLPTISRTVPAGRTIARATYGTANTVTEITGLTPGASFDLVTGRPWVGLGNELKSIEWR